MNIISVGIAMRCIDLFFEEKATKGNKAEQTFGAQLSLYAEDFVYGFGGKGGPAYFASHRQSFSVGDFVDAFLQAPPSGANIVSLNIDAGGVWEGLSKNPLRMHMNLHNLLYVKIPCFSPWRRIFYFRGGHKIEFGDRWATKEHDVLGLVGDMNLVELQARLFLFKGLCERKFLVNPLQVFDAWNGKEDGEVVVSFRDGTTLRARGERGAFAGCRLRGLCPG